MISGIESNSIKESESLKVLRAVRVLRPLKIVSGIPSEFFSFPLVSFIEYSYFHTGMQLVLFTV